MRKVYTADETLVVVSVAVDRCAVRSGGGPAVPETGLL